MLGALAAQEGQAPRTRCSIAAFLRDRLARLASAGALQLHWQVVQVSGNGRKPCIDGASAAALAICPCVSNFRLETQHKYVQWRSEISSQSSISASFPVLVRLQTLHSLCLSEYRRWMKSIPVLTLASRCSRVSRCIDV